MWVSRDVDLLGRIVHAIGDPDSPAILRSITDSPKNARNVSEDTGIPLSSVYRKLATLKKARLARVFSYETTKEGKKQALFAASVNEVRIIVNNEDIEFGLAAAQEDAGSSSPEPTVGRSLSSYSDLGQVPIQTS